MIDRNKIQQSLDKATRKLIKTKRPNLKVVERFFIADYNLFLFLNPNIKSTEFTSPIDKDLMSKYFYDKKWTLDIAYKNIEKTKNLRSEEKNAEKVKSQLNLAERIEAYNKALYYLEECT